MKNKKRLIYLMSTIIITVFLLGCNDQNKKEQNKINVLITENAVGDTEFFDSVIEKYSQEGNEVNLIKIKEEDLNENIIKSTNSDFIYTNRNNMLKLVKQELVKELNDYYAQNNLLEKLYIGNISYGRSDKSYYGVTVNPYSLVLLVNNDLYELTNDNLLEATLYTNYIPSLLPKKININTAISSLIANNTNLSWKLSDAYEESKETYESISEGQLLFNNIKRLYDEKKIQRDKFMLVGEEFINKFKNGEIPILLTTTLISSKLIGNENFTVLNKAQLDLLDINSTFDASGVILVSTKNKNDRVINDFLSYFTDEHKLDYITEKGIITGNKIADDKLSGNKSVLQKTIIDCNENNIIYEENLPSDMLINLKVELENSFKGIYDGKEWSRVVSTIK